MSHTVPVNLIADQEIKLLGKTVNIYNLKTIVLNENGKVVEFYHIVDGELIDVYGEVR